MNNKLLLCTECLNELSKINYPVKYEQLRRNFFVSVQSRNLARQDLISRCIYFKISKIVIPLFGALALILYPALCFLSLYKSILIIALGLISVYFLANLKHKERILQWDKTFPEPVEPELLHFHDPRAVLTSEDHKILQIFNYWPGYPPYWQYLRTVTLKQDNYRCQVTGCPSRTSLHVHHIIPCSNGGAHTPSNLVTLCDFHHAMEPDIGHSLIWGNIKNEYFTLVKAHTRSKKDKKGELPLRT